MSWSFHETSRLIRQLEKLGCMLIRHGAKHDWYRNPDTGVSQPVAAASRNQRSLGVKDN